MAALLVFIGGGLGSLIRYLISMAIPVSTFPRATLISNVVSCIILGMLMGFYSKQILSDQQRLFFMTGFCGGFSTFSTFSGELVTMFHNNQFTWTLLYLSMSIILGISSIILGVYISKLIA
jgi:fluoride exporter